MSILLSTFSPYDRRGPLEVVLATTEAERREVQHLRYRIYVEEMRLIDPKHDYVDGERLVDPYDAWSSHVLVRRHGRAVGTSRVTSAGDGPMELDEFTDVHRHLPADARPAEITRYMVLKEERGKKAGPAALYGALRIIAASPTTHAVAAAKLGSLSRYYTSAGLELLSDEAFTYGLTGCQYRVGAIHFGRAGSLRRLAMVNAYRALKMAADVASPVTHLVFRRRLSAEKLPRPTGLAEEVA